MKSGARKRAQALPSATSATIALPPALATTALSPGGSFARNRRNGDIERARELELLGRELDQARHRADLGDGNALGRIGVEPLGKDARLLAHVRRGQAQVRRGEVLGALSACMPNAPRPANPAAATARNALFMTSSCFPHTLASASAETTPPPPRVKRCAGPKFAECNAGGRIGSASAGFGLTPAM